MAYWLNQELKGSIQFANKHFSQVYLLLYSTRPPILSFEELQHWQLQQVNPTPDTLNLDVYDSIVQSSTQGKTFCIHCKTEKNLDVSINIEELSEHIAKVHSQKSDT